MDRYVCTICGYVYDPVKGDPDNGIAPGTKFEDLPEDCSAGVLARRLLGAGVTHILKPYPPLKKGIDFSILENEYLQQVFIHRGLTLYKLVDSS